MTISNEWLFKRVYSNAERILEHQVFGWMSQPLDAEVLSPIKIQPIVEQVAKKIGKNMRCEKPDLDSGDMLLKLRELSQTGAYGVLFARLSLLWQTYYDSREAA